MMKNFTSFFGSLLVHSKKLKKLFIGEDFTHCKEGNNWCTSSINVFNPNMFRQSKMGIISV